MIDVEIRHGNRIVNLSSPAKTPIKSRNGSPYFYNSMELVCVSVGSCFGKELMQFCTENSINPKIFESIQVTMENFIPKIILSHPDTLSRKFKNDIHLIATNCPVAKMLKNGVEIKFIINNTPTEKLIDETKTTSCCGN